MADSDELAKLGDLHQRGMLTDEEFALAKARVLRGGPRAGESAPPWSAVNQWRRSTRDRWIAGVCGGIAEFTGIAAWAVRLVFMLLLLCGGTGLLVYGLCWFFVPPDGLQRPETAGV